MEQEPTTVPETRPLEGAIATDGGAVHGKIVFVEDDELFRVSLAGNLQDAGFTVVEFDNGAAALDYFTQGGDAELGLFDWKMPELTGIELLQRLKERGVDLPVIFLTSLGGQVYEETAFMNGAVDFIDKSRSFSILLNRIGTVITGRKGLYVPVAPGAPQAVIRCGDLELCLNSNRAFWKKQRVSLTLAEFKIVHHLVTEVDRDIPHREIYDIVRGPGFVAGEGEDGYRANVRTFIKRIRQKFCEVDDAFDRIATYSGFGYRWIGGVPPSS